LVELSTLSSTRLSTLQRRLAGAITVLALLAVGLSSYLTWVTWQQSTVAGCTGSSAVGCDEVLTSAGSKWLGIPVSLIGALTYMGILALVWPAVMLGGWAMIFFLALSMLAAGAGVWFIGTQALVVQHFCLYCLAIHACGLLICTAAMLIVREASSETRQDHMSGIFGGDAAMYPEASTTGAFQPLIAAGIAAVGLLALIAGQVFFAASGMEVVENVPLEAVDEPAEDDDTVPVEATDVSTEPTEPSEEPAEPAADPVVATDEGEKGIAEETEPAEDAPAEDLEIVQDNGDDDSSLDSLFETSADAPRFFRFKYLKREIDAAGNPVLGNPYAERRFVEMLDYTCQHCRKLHPFVDKAVERYGDQLGFVIYHVPLSRKCNPAVKVDSAGHQNACEYARLAYGVWKLDPTKFAEYHDWLMTGDKAPPVYQAKKKAMELVGEAILMDKSIEAESGKRVSDASAELQPLNVGLPVLIFDQGVIRGMPDSEQEWFEVLESRMGLKAVASVTN
jgi:uncharacterized membrane protein/protein-disulfide isomerase